MILEIALGALLSCDPGLTALFTPVRPEAGRYEVCTTPRGLETTVDVAVADGFTTSAPEWLDPLDAFGAAGPYDRGALTRLYAGHRPRVVRGWRRQGERLESLTVISPFPDAGLRELNSGTLVMRLTLDTARTGPTRP